MRAQYLFISSLGIQELIIAIEILILNSIIHCQSDRTDLTGLNQREKIAQKSPQLRTFY